MKHETRSWVANLRVISEPDLTLLERPLSSDPRLHATRPLAQGGGGRLARARIGERGAAPLDVGVPGRKNMVHACGRNPGKCVGGRVSGGTAGKGGGPTVDTHKRTSDRNGAPKGTGKGRRAGAGAGRAPPRGRAAWRALRGAWGRGVRPRGGDTCSAPRLPLVRGPTQRG